MKEYYILVCLLTCLCLTGAFAQERKLDAYFQSVGKQLNGDILLEQNGKILAAKAFGYADFETGKPNTIDLRFDLASVSKLFTSTAILQLAEKGKLSLDDSVIKFLPDFPFPKITVRHLLTHTSGLPDLELFESLIRTYPDTVITNKNILPELKKWKQGLYFKPGDRYQYCNTGYDLLAMIVEKVSGMNFPDYLERYVFRITGMRDTYVSVYRGRFYLDDKRCVRMHAQPHPYYDTTYLYVDSLPQARYTNYNCRGTIGDANVITTTEDMARFDKAFFDGRLLKPATMEEALTPLKLNSGETWYGPMDTMLGEGKMTVGLGWDIFIQPGYGRSVGHGGFKFGLATFYFHNLQNKQTIIAFDNTAGSEFGRIVTSAFFLLNGKDPMPVRTSKSLAFVYGSTLVKEGPDAAACALNVIKSDTAHYYLSEWEFNQLGGNLLNRSSFAGHEQLAAEVFMINTLLFPNSANTYDSYAYCLRRLGKKKEAIEMYRTSLAMEPNNDDGKQALKELLSGNN